MSSIKSNEKSNNIQVVARFRPQNELEKQIDGTSCVEFDADHPEYVLLKVSNFF